MSSNAQAASGPSPPPEGDGEGRPMDLLGALEASDHFRRDSPLGALFHPGKVSFREMSATDSLHVVVHGNRLSAHVDDVSPLRLVGRGSGRLRQSRYACARVMSHNLRGMLADARRRLEGRHGAQRCHLECDTVWVDDEAVAPVHGPGQAAPGRAGEAAVEPGP